VIQERKHIRLKGWSYSSEGTYFITICCKDRHNYFGTVNNEEMAKSDIGKISSNFWSEIPDHFPHVKLDVFVVMPNHIHGILTLDYSLVGLCHDMTLHPTGQDRNHKTNKFGKPIKNSVSVIINQYKSSVKRWCNTNGFNSFEWQSRFYDQILTNEESIENIREYIRNNVKNWSIDELNIQ
jgi:putative transposase